MASRRGALAAPKLSSLLRHLIPARPLTAGPNGTALNSVLAPPAQASHLFGVPRRVTLTAVHGIAIAYTRFLNRMKVYNSEVLQELVHARPKGTPLITISNHMSTVDDPFLWGQKGLRSSDHKLCRWTLTAKDICFTGPVLSYIFRLGKSIPIDRFGGIRQPGMTECVERLHAGDWVHIFPEARVLQGHDPIGRLKWGLASLLDRLDTSVKPILLCVGHSGFETMMPEKYMFDRRPYIPLWFKNISVVVGDPFSLDIGRVRSEADTALEDPASTFGIDALTYAPEVLEEKFAAEQKERREAGSKDAEELIEEAAFRRKIQNILDVGDLRTRRIYSEAMRDVQWRLDRTVSEAHAHQLERATHSK